MMRSRAWAYASRTAGVGSASYVSNPVDRPLWSFGRAERHPGSLSGGAVGGELTGGRYEHRRAKYGGRDSPYRPRPGPTPDKNDPPDPHAV